MRLCIIHNVNSGKHKSRKHADKLARVLGAHDVTVVGTSSVDALNEFMAQKPDYDAFIIIGGDGTVGPTINAMKAHGVDIPIYCFGRGTANDYASFMKTNCGYKRAAKIIKQNRVSHVDTLFVNNSVYACNVACGGAFTSGATHYNKHAKRIFGKFAYFVTGFVTAFGAKSQTLKFTVDEKSFELDTFLFYILNTKNVGGLKNGAPLAAVDDGELGLLVIKRCNFFGKLSVAFHQSFGIMHRCRHVVHLQGKNFTVSHTPNATPHKSFTITDLDGNPYAPYPITVTVGTKIRVIHR
jgi:YegS/Rv2252/BmrU family lipid kinase